MKPPQGHEEVKDWPVLASPDHHLAHHEDLDLERKLHQDQWREHRRYKNELVHTLRWLLAEARWYAWAHADQDGGWFADYPPYVGELPWLS